MTQKRNRFTCFPALTGSLLMALTWMACTSDPIPSGQTANSRYFDLEHFFNDEAARLQRSNPTIDKTVSKNEASESRVVQIENWKNELGLFIDSDINKPAWQNSYRIDSTANGLTTYTREDQDLRTQKISIEKNNDGTIKHIAVVNQVGNMLYQTKELLDYYPDSLYRITREQSVRIIGESRYEIVGVSQR